MKVLVRLQRRDGPVERRAALSLLSVQYGASAVRLLPFNVTELGWTLDRRGVLKALRQDMTVLGGTARRSVQAVYEARRGSTIVRDGRRLFERDGVVPLRLITSRGTLDVDYERK
jgi:hypothetical protein